MKLLYHPLESESTVSPFDEAILEVAWNQHVIIISPYFGLSYLQRLVHCCADWSIVSDIQEWLSATRHERSAVVAFITAHREKIHHYPALHAKAVISPLKAYLGSANLTTAGIQFRTEVGVKIDEPNTVQELNRWANGLWHRTNSPNLVELAAFVQQLPAPAPSASVKNQPKVSGIGLPVRAKLSTLPSRTHEPRSAVPSVPEVFAQMGAQSLSLKNLFERVSDGSSASRRRIMATVYAMCANLARSAYRGSSTPDLIWADSSLHQGNQTSLQDAATPYDTFLAEVINQLSFETPACVDLPRATNRSSIPARYAHTLLKELICAGLLIPEACNAYLLNDDVNWPPTRRYYQFQRAGIAWDAAVSRSRASRARAVIPTTIPPVPPLLLATVPEVALIRPETPKPKIASPSLKSISTQSAGSRPPAQSAYVTAAGHLRPAGMDALFASALTLALADHGFLPYASEAELFAAIKALTAVPLAFFRALTGAKGITCPLKPPIILKRAVTKKGWVVSRTTAPATVLAQLPLTKKALETYLAHPGVAADPVASSSPPLNGTSVSQKGASAVRVAAAPVALSEASPDAICLLLANLLEQSSGQLSIKSPDVLFTYMAASLHTSPSRVKAVLTPEALQRSSALFWVQEGAGRLTDAITFNPTVATKSLYPQSTKFIQKHKNKGGYFSRMLASSSVSSTGTASSGSTHARLDLIQFELLKLANKQGVLRGIGLREVRRLLRPSIPDLAEADLLLLLQSSKSSLIVPALVLQAQSRKKPARLLLRTPRGSLNVYPLTKSALPSYQLAEQPQVPRT